MAELSGATAPGRVSQNDGSKQMKRGFSEDKVSVLILWELGGELLLLIRVNRR